MTGTEADGKYLEGTGKWRRSLAEAKDENRLNTLGAFYSSKNSETFETPEDPT